MGKFSKKNTIPKKKVVRAALEAFFEKPHFSPLNFIFLVRGLQTTKFPLFAEVCAKTGGAHNFILFYVADTS